MSLKLPLIKTMGLLILSFSMTPLWAKDLGVVGKIYPIAEEDLLAFIENRVKNMQENGEWKKSQDQWKKRVLETADRPPAIDGLHKTVTHQKWHYDPSLILTNDLKDVQGNVFAKRGTRINPLTFTTLHTALVFFDGDDQAQIKWVRKLINRFNKKIKLVLVKGSITEQARIFQQPIYFDQQGKLVHTFHITHIPALVYQNKQQLVIEEVVAE